MRLRIELLCITPNAFDRASGVQYKQGTCIDQSAYEELLSMWSHRKKINFTRTFVETKQIDYVDCSKFRAYPAVVGIKTSHCVIAEKNTWKDDHAGKAKIWPKTHWSLDEWIFLSKAAIWRTWKIFPGKQQRMASLDKSEYLTYPTRPTKYKSD